MGFPILSLTVTRIIGIPQSLLLRVLGFPNSYPGSMGFPMPFSAFLRRSFSRVLGFPNSHPGSMGFPMPFSAFLRRLFFFISIQTSSEFPRVFPTLLHDHDHWFDMGCTSNYTMNLTFASRPRGFHDQFPTPRNCKTSQNRIVEISTKILAPTLEQDHQEIEISQYHKTREKRNFPYSKKETFSSPLTRKLSKDGAVDLLSNCDEAEAGCCCGEGAHHSFPFFSPLPFFPRPFC